MSTSHRALTAAARLLQAACQALLWPLAACTTLAPAVAPQAALAVPARWSAGGGAAGVSAASLSAWWRCFDDPVLVAMVDAALQANSSVNAALAALGQARALRDVAAAGLWPTLDGTASAQRGMAAGRSTGNLLRIGLDAGWDLDLFGARRAAVDAGRADVQASQASLDDVQVQIAAEVALNYILLRNAQARAAIAASSLASQEETLQITRWRTQAGLATVLDSDQAQAAVEQSRAALPLLHTAAAQTRHALAVLGGQPPAAWDGLLGTRAPAASAASAASPLPGLRACQVQAQLLGVPAEVLRQRADVRAAEWQVAAALARVGQAEAQRRPSFAIGGTLGLSAGSLGALAQRDAGLGSLLASVTLPLLHGGALRAQVRAQQAALDGAQQRYRAVVLAALQQVEDAQAALDGNRQRLASLHIAARAAADAALLARQRYGSGLIDFQAVLETQRSAYATQDSLASTRADLSGDHVRLFRALGGGWSPLLPHAQATAP